jgi:hypothetical protein
MQIRYLWPTSVGLDTRALPEQVREDLIRVLVRKDQERPKVGLDQTNWEKFVQSKKLYSSTHYNLFAEADQHPEVNSIKAFESFSIACLKDYLAEAFGMGAEYEFQFSGRCFGNVQYPGGRTFPHYHQSTDIVLIHYLDVGNGIDPEAMKTQRHGSHALLLLDPRGSPNFPWFEKIESISPHQGMTVLHPGYLWHETNPWREAQGTRVCIVVNFQITSPGYGSLHQPIIG